MPTPSPKLRRLAAIFVIALAAYALSLLLQLVLPSALARTNDLAYDSYYRTRPAADLQNAEVLLVIVDDAGLRQVDKVLKKGWPWPREYYGHICKYLETSGAKAIAFDFVFTETSSQQDLTGDDDQFAELIKSLKIPVVFGSGVNSDGSWEHFAPPIESPVHGVVTLGGDRMFRKYPPTVAGKNSLAAAAVLAAKETPLLPLDRPFLLHYYGPYKTPSGNHTFRYVSAAGVLGAQIDAIGPTPNPAAAKALGITPGLFKNKIVILGGVAKGTYDLKSSPLSEEYPGPEVQATAIVNLFRGDQVTPVAPFLLYLLPFFCSLLVTAGIVIPRRATLKLAAPILITAGLLLAGVLLFRADHIRWLPPVQSLIAIASASLGAFAWTYFAEDRQRRFMLKALSKVVSPAVADQLAREPERLALGTTRAQLTILFTDLADFTTLSEGMDVNKLGEMLNRYLNQMSDQVLNEDGTLDKYIGDAIMCFWNAPLAQADHAAKACHTALAMIQREKALAEEFAAMGAKKIFTRIGINTASVAVGFVGSSHLFNYTVLGDGVNLASRVEGANKMFGTQILITENTALLVKNLFHLRKVDVVRVKGKKEPMPLYELLADKQNIHADHAVQLARQYEKAFAAYQNQRWDESQKLLLELLQSFGEDAPSRTLLKRIAIYRNSPPPQNWDGIHDSTEK